MNEKRENFKRISENRRERILDIVNKLHNLTNKSFYDYTEEDVSELFDPIEEALEKERSLFMKTDDVKLLVKEKLEELGFQVYPNNDYTFTISKNGENKCIKVINTKSKYAKWSLSKNDEEVVDDLFYIFVRDNGNYKFHIVPSRDVSFNIKEYHRSFIETNGGNGATGSLRQFLDKPSVHQPDKKENEYLDKWNIIL